MANNDSTPAATKLKLPRFQYSLRTLLIDVTVVSVLCSMATYIGWSFVFHSLQVALRSISGYIYWGVSTASLALVTVVGVIALARRFTVEFVRLLAAVLIALGSCWFVVEYNYFAEVRFPFDHQGQTPYFRTELAEFVTAHQVHAYAVPVLGLRSGCLIILRRPNWKILLELVVQALWLLAFAWVGLVLVVWQIQNIPVFSAMQWRY